MCCGKKLLLSLIIFLHSNFELIPLAEPSAKELPQTACSCATSTASEISAPKTLPGQELVIIGQEDRNVGTSYQIQPENADPSAKEASTLRGGSFSGLTQKFSMVYKCKILLSYDNATFQEQEDRENIEEKAPEIKLTNPTGAEKTLLTPKEVAASSAVAGITNDIAQALIETIKSCKTSFNDPVLYSAQVSDGKLTMIFPLLGEDAMQMAWSIGENIAKDYSCRLCINGVLMIPPDTALRVEYEFIKPAELRLNYSSATYKYIGDEFFKVSIDLEEAKDGQSTNIKIIPFSCALTILEAQ